MKPADLKEIREAAENERIEDFRKTYERELGVIYEQMKEIAAKPYGATYGKLSSYTNGFHCILEVLQKDGFKCEIKCERTNCFNVEKYATISW